MEIDTKIIAVVHTVPWDLASGTFCTLQPIADISGGEIYLSDFYNRGRIWWKVRAEDRFYSSLGKVIALDVEEAPGFIQTDNSSDFYQVEMGTVSNAGNYIAEIVQIDGSISQESLIENLRLPSNHPINGGIVFCRSGDYVLGPFKSTCNEQIEPDKHYVNLILSPGWGSNPLRRMEWKDFSKLAQPRTIPIQLFRESHERNAVEIEYSFFLKANIERVIASHLGSIVDHRSDTMVVGEVIKALNWSRADKQAFKKFVEEFNSADISLERIHKNKNRILKIVQKIEENEKPILEMIDAIMKDKKFQVLLEKRQEELANDFIEKQRKNLELQADEKILHKKNELADLETSFTKLVKLIETEKKEKIQECERELSLKSSRLEASFKKKEDALSKKEEVLVEKQANISNLVKSLNENRDEMISQIVCLMPLLKEIGFHTSSEMQLQISNEKREEHSSSEERPGLIQNIVTSSYKPLHGKLSSLSEKKFIDRWIKLANDSGFAYNEKDLINFHVCTKSENFNILTGPSGIGKSSLPRFYSQALHGNAEGEMRFLMVSVKPGWLDSQDLLGYFNALDGRFQPSSSGFYQFLVASACESNESESGVYICCLDEMNLSYVEHYFSDFLGLLQAPLEDRQLRLFEKSLCRPEDPYIDYGTIHIPNSLRFCGTVNVDETTKFFSPKVLDRVHIIELAPVALSDVNSWDARKPDFSAIGHPISEGVFRSWLQEPGLSQAYVLKILTEFDNHLSKVGLRISPRTFKSICRYVSNAREVMETDEEAMDFAIFQRLLPVLRGHTPQFREILFKLHELCESRDYKRSSLRIKHISEAEVAMDFFNYAMV